MSWLHGLLAVTFVAAGIHPFPFEAPTVDGDETHCVAHVVDQSADGEFTLSPAACFDTFGAALDFATGGRLADDTTLSLSGPALLADPEAGAILSNFTLGIHFDGSNGTGSSIQVVGSSCTGGWWNTGGTWANRISSSWNGCYRLRHYDSPNKVGIWADTTGVGQTDNIPSLMNNRAESVAYFGS
jgi:hypothetical protein